MISAAEYLADKRVSRLDALATVREYVDFADSGRGARVIEVRLAGGLSFDVLPDRGLDIGAVWHEGNPVAWRSALPSGESAGLDPTDSFLGRFTGGMLVTCGWENIGPPIADLPMHGSHHRTPASDVHWMRELVGSEIVVTVSGLIASMQLFGRRVVVHRKIVACTGSAQLEVIDRIHNEGLEASPIALLYHVNFGAPFLDEGTRVEVECDSIVPREDALNLAHATEFPAPSSTLAESVYELVRPRGPRARATVIPKHGGTAVLEWSVAALPRLYEWVWPASGGWALAIEPANTALFGPQRRHPNAGAPMIQPGATIETGFTLSFARTTHHSEKRQTA